MSGIEDIKVLDSCVCMNFLNERLRALPDGRHCISVVTRMEILANPKHTQQTKRKAETFLQNIFVVALTDEIERIAIKIRRSGSPRSKLPDAIVAATAVVLDASLVTQDSKLLALQWHGLQTSNSKYQKNMVN